jgi:methyl-accepting chemotaxis protein
MDDQRRSTTRLWAILIWLPVPLCLAITLAAGQAVLIPLGLSALLAALASLAVAWWRDGLAARLTAAASLASLASVLVWVLWATPWAAGGDIAYAAMLALLAGYRDRRVLAAAAAAAVLQRGGLALLLPPAASAATFAAAAAPLAMLLIEAAALAWLIRVLDGTVAALRGESAAAQQAALQRERALRLMSETASDLAGQATADRLARQFEADVGILVGTAARAAAGVRGAVLKISGVAGETAQQTAAITGASVQTSASAKSVAASVEQLAASVARVTREVREVSEASYKAMEDAGATNETVQKLADTAAQIGNIVRVIRGITEQTNLLALNATIEAARAGEAGKGFSVVAGEVKALARQTARATEDIQAQIGSIGEDMARAIAAIDGIAATVAHLGGITVSVAGAMEEQAGVAQDIANSASRAAASTETVVSNLHSLADGAARADAAAREGRSDAEQLARQCDGVEAAVKDFVGNLLSA